MMRLQKITLLDIFPEFRWIASEELRECCLNTWLDAAEKGGWDESGLKKLPFVITELKDCPVLLIDHVKNVTAAAKQNMELLNQRYPARRALKSDVVIAGAMLHDVGKLLEYEKYEGGYRHSSYGDFLRHPVAGAILAAENGVPDEIVHIIATHSFEGDRSHQTKEAYIVKASDWLNFNYLSFEYPSQMER